MKRFLPAILLLFGAVSCIDNAYDLSNIDTDSMAIGTEISEFHLPVARITISAGKLGSSDKSGYDSFLDLYREADIWFPSTLPGGADAVEVERLSTDNSYRQSLLDALFDEMDTSAGKRNAVCGLVADKYRTTFLNSLSNVIDDATRREITEASPEQAAAMIADLYVNFNSITRTAISAIANTYLSAMRLEQMEYEIPALELSDDIRDMLDEGGYLYGSVESELPVRIRISPRYRIAGGTLQPFAPLTIEPDETAALQEIALIGTDFQNFLNGGITFYLDSSVKRYYPARGLREDQSVFINLKFRKTGDLKL